jgi:glycosyltransferase involved in cell wall biosynthesis
MSKTNILFVGSFAHLSKSGHSGGMTKMCQYILDSNISEQVNWYLLDSTAPHNRLRSFIERLVPAIKRLFYFVWLLLTKRVDKVFVFAAQGFGFYEKGLMILLAKLFRKDTVLALRSGFLMKDIRASKSFKKRARIIFKYCDVIICQSSNWINFLESEVGVSSQKITIIANTVDMPQNKVELTAHNPVNFLFMGFIEKNKGIFDLITALSGVESSDWHLDIAGEGIGSKRIKNKIRESGLEEQITYHGWVHGAEKDKLLQNADVIILPSYHEGMPNVLLEAMASSTAVIASNVGGIPDLVEHGQNGYLVEAGDIDQLAYYMNVYLLKREIIPQHKAAGKLKIESSFSLEVIIPKFAHVLINN